MSARPWWLYVVLTFDPKGFPDQFAAFKEAGGCWNNSLREALRHRVGKVDYLQTWETTRGGWPHVNLILAGDGLRQFVEAQGVELVEHRGRARGPARRCLFPRGFRRWLRDAAVRAGFGPVSWCEVLAPGAGDAMAGYLVKLAKELTGAQAKKGDQSPLHAPRHFRRIRASRGLLPAAQKGGGEWTGALVRGRIVREPSEARKPRQKAAELAATWDDVEHLREHLAREARRLGKEWGTNAEVQLLRERLPNGSQPREPQVPVSPRPGAGDVGGRGADAEREARAVAEACAGT